MIAVDASVLAFAVNRHAPEHARAAAALDALANGDLPWALVWPAVEEFLRFVTRPHVAPRPLSPSDALGFVEALLDSPSATALGPTDRHAAVLAELLAGVSRSAPLPTGFEVAAVLREHGVRELLSVDGGMRRFAFLAVIDPVHGPVWTPDSAPARRYRRLGPARS
jgi:toxin-antitoxin system PIN domain toxin